MTKCAGGSNGCQFADVNGIALTNYSWFGNYALLPGTMMLARPFGGSYGNSGTGATSGNYTDYDVGYGIKGAPSNPANIGNVSGGGQYYYAYGSSWVSHPGTVISGAAAIFYQSVGLTQGSQSEDMMMGVFGPSWNYLRPGDTVNIKIVHTPSGRTIVNKDVIVEG